jgi:hypothetical protein
MEGLQTYKEKKDTVYIAVAFGTGFIVKKEIEKKILT